MNAVTILNWIDMATAMIASLPSPIQGPAALALGIEKIALASVKAHMETSGETIEQVMAKIKHETPVP